MEAKSISLRPKIRTSSGAMHTNIEPRKKMMSSRNKTSYIGSPTETLKKSPDSIPH